MSVLAKMGGLHADSKSPSKSPAKSPAKSPGKSPQTGEKSPKLPDSSDTSAVLNAVAERLSNMDIAGELESASAARLRQKELPQLDETALESAREAAGPKALFDKSREGSPEKGALKVEAVEVSEGAAPAALPADLPIAPPAEAPKAVGDSKLKRPELKKRTVAGRPEPK